MTDHLHEATIKTNSLSFIKNAKIDLNRHENIHTQLHDFIHTNCSDEDKRLHDSNMLNVRINDIRVLNHKETPHLNSLEYYGIPKNHKLNIMIEHSNKTSNFDDHFHVLRFNTKTANDVKLFNSWMKSAEKDGHFMEVWHEPGVDRHADIRVYKSFVPANSPLDFNEHIPDLKQCAENTLKINDTTIDGKFHSLDEIYNITKLISDQANATPGLQAKVFSIGQSTRGNDVQAIRIGKHNPNNVERPKFVFTSGIHAREWIGPSTLLHISSQIAEGDSEMNNLLNYCDVYFVPMVNPDGYEYTFTDGNRLWRKNMMAVDLNRNFNSHFDSCKEDSDSHSENYCGPGPESEIETKNIVNFFHQLKKVAGYIDFHCYGNYFCFQYSHTDEPPENYDLLLRCAKTTINSIKSVNNTPYKYGSIYDTIYKCSGTLIDYLSEKNITQYAFVNELKDTGHGFLTPAKCIKSVGVENFIGLKAFIGFILEHEHPEILHPPSIVAKVPSGLRSSHRIYNPIGLANLGNTCYANSIIQCFGAISMLNGKKLALSGESSGNEFLKSFGKIHNSFWGGKNCTKSQVRKLLSFAYNKGNSFRPGMMADASEFALFCVNNLKKSKLGQEPFEGKLINFVGNDINKEDFFQLALPITKDSTLTDLIRANFQQENVGNTVKTSRIEEFPNLLMITLKQDAGNGMCNLKAPKSMCLRNYALPNTKGDGIYELRAVALYHEITTSSGHYTSLVKSGKKEWMHIDDDKLTKTTLEENNGMLNLSAPHVILYQIKKSDSARLVVY